MTSEHAAAEIAGQEVVDQAMQTGLPAKMLQSGARRLGWIQATDAKFSLMLIGFEPVVDFLSLDATSVAGYCLPDHRSSSPEIYLSIQTRSLVPERKKVETAAKHTSKMAIRILRSQNRTGAA